MTDGHGSRPSVTAAVNDGGCLRRPWVVATANHGGHGGHRSRRLSVTAESGRHRSRQLSVTAAIFHGGPRFRLDERRPAVVRWCAHARSPPCARARTHAHRRARTHAGPTTHLYLPQGRLRGRARCALSRPRWRAPARACGRSSAAKPSTHACRATAATAQRRRSGGDG